MLKLVWSILSKSNGKVLHQLEKYTANENSGVGKIKQNRLMLLSNCSICGKKTIDFYHKSRTQQFQQHLKSLAQNQ